MKYPELFEERVPSDTRIVYTDGNGWHLTGTITWACGHRGIARIALRSVDHPLAPLFFEVERHFYCLSCYSQWHRRFHMAQGDWYAPRCPHNLNPVQWFADTAYHSAKAHTILRDYADTSLYPEPFSPEASPAPRQ